jgi:hypothetical protein
VIALTTKYFTLTPPFGEVEVLVRYADGKMERITRADGRWIEEPSLFRILTDDGADQAQISPDEAVEVARLLGHPNALSE